MKTWDYGVNSLHKTRHVWFEEAPWYIFAIDSFTTWLCDYFPPIPFPAIGMTDEDGEKTTWKEYKGSEINKVSISLPYFRNLLFFLNHESFVVYLYVSKFVQS